MCVMQLLRSELITGCSPTCHQRQQLNHILPSLNRFVRSRSKASCFPIKCLSLHAKLFFPSAFKGAMQSVQALHWVCCGEVVCHNGKKSLKNVQSLWQKKLLQGRDGQRKILRCYQSVFYFLCREHEWQYGIRRRGFDTAEYQDKGQRRD